MPLSAQQRFLALQSGEIDVLVRNSTITLQRDAGLGLQYSGIDFYDGQGFMVSKKLGVKGLAELATAPICVAQGTTHEFGCRALRAGSAAWHDLKTVVFESQDVMYEAFFARPLRCHHAKYRRHSPRRWPRGRQQAGLAT